MGFWQCVLPAFVVSALFAKQALVLGDCKSFLNPTVIRLVDAGCVLLDGSPFCDFFYDNAPHETELEWATDVTLAFFGNNARNSPNPATLKPVGYGTLKWDCGEKVLLLRQDIRNTKYCLYQPNAKVPVSCLGTSSKPLSEMPNPYLRSYLRQQRLDGTGQPNLENAKVVDALMLVQHQDDDSQIIGGESEEKDDNLDFLDQLQVRDNLVK